MELGCEKEESCAPAGRLDEGCDIYTEGKASMIERWGLRVYA